MTYSFYTEPDKLTVQQEENRFGYNTSINGLATFRTNSKHTATEDPYAIAICKCLIAILPTDSPQHVNLILKPFQESRLSVLNNVSAFVYRGVKKSSITNDGTSIIQPSGGQADTDLIIKVEEDRISQNEADEENEETNIQLQNIPISDFGYSIDELNAFIIDDIFSSDDYTPFIVKAGDTLGYFDAQGFSVEAHTFSNNYNHTFNNAKKYEFTFIVDDIPSDSPIPQLVVNRNERAGVASFVPLETILGRLFYQGLRIQNSQVVETIRKGDIKQLIDAYFVNSHHLFIDLKDEFGLSLGTTQPVAIPLEISIRDNVPGSFDYWQSGWPLLRVDLTDNSGFSDSIKQLRIGLRLPCFGGVKSTDTYTYLDCGQYFESSEDHRIRRAERKAKVSMLFPDLDTDFFNVINLGLINNNDELGVSPLTSLVRLYLGNSYNRRPRPFGIPLEKSHDLSLVFDLNRLEFNASYSRSLLLSDSNRMIELGAVLNNQDVNNTTPSYLQVSAMSDSTTVLFMINTRRKIDPDFELKHFNFLDKPQDEQASNWDFIQRELSQSFFGRSGRPTSDTEQVIVAEQLTPIGLEAASRLPYDNVHTLTFEKTQISEMVQLTNSNLSSVSDSSGTSFIDKLPVYIGLRYDSDYSYNKTVKRYFVSLIGYTNDNGIFKSMNLDTNTLTYFPLN